MMSLGAMWLVMSHMPTVPQLPTLEEIQQRMKAQAERFEAIEAQRVKNAINNPVAD